MTAPNYDGCYLSLFVRFFLSRWNTALFDNSMHHITACQHKTWAYIKAIIHLCLHLNLLWTILLLQRSILERVSPSLHPLPAPLKGKEGKTLIWQVGTCNDSVTAIQKCLKSKNQSLVPVLLSWVVCAQVSRGSPWKFRLHILSPLDIRGCLSVTV